VRHKLNVFQDSQCRSSERARKTGDIWQEFVEVAGYIPEDVKSLGMFIKIPESLVQMLVCKHWKWTKSVQLGNKNAGGFCVFTFRRISLSTNKLPRAMGA